MMNVTAPKVTRSPGDTGVGVVTRQPFTLVPLVDPRSDRSQPLSACSKLACQRDTVMSDSIRSQAVSRPMVKRSCGPTGSISDAGAFRVHWSAAEKARRHERDIGPQRLAETSAPGKIGNQAA